MSKRIDLTGNKYGRLTVISFAGSKNTHAMWNCKCDCGNELVVQYSNLIRSTRRGCNKCREGNIKHGFYNHPLFHRWETLKAKNVLCKEWLVFSKYLKDVELTYEEGFRMRRVNKSKPHSITNSLWCKGKVKISLISGIRLF